MSAQHVTRTQDDSKTTLGFWIYLMTDCVVFASLFASFAVLRNNTYGGPSGKDLFDLEFVLIESLLLLTSSLTVGLGVLAARRHNARRTLLLFAATFLLGVAFLSMEMWEFRHLVIEGHGWRESAFLTSFFTLVGTHGLHIAIGLIWMAVLLPRIYAFGLNAQGVKRLTLLSLYWHFLDIIWIFIFTVVYLYGALPS